MIAFVWRFQSPEVVHSFSGLRIYFLLILALTPLVSIIGWFGASLTFPIEKE